jgi:hypothetical protein
METPNLIELSFPYFIWFLIIVLTNYFFTFYSNKTKSTGKILIYVFLTVWLLLTIFTFIINLIHPFGIYSSDFGLQLAFNLPQIIVFGGIAFFVKYRKLNKKY